MNSSTIYKTAWIPLMVAGFIALVGWWADRNVKEAMRKELREQLQSNLQAGVGAMTLWIHAQHKTATFIARDPGIEETILQLAKFGAESSWDPGVLADAPAQLALREDLHPRLQHCGYPEYVVIGPGGEVFAAARPERIGFRFSTDDHRQFHRLFQMGEPLFAPPFSTEERTDLPIQIDSIMMVCVPVFNEMGKVIAALGLVIRPDEEFTRILSVAAAQETSETYAFNEAGIMISQSRHLDRLKQLGLVDDNPDATSVLTVQLRDPGESRIPGDLFNQSKEVLPFTRMAASATAGESDVNVDGYSNYLGDKVVGAWSWLDDLNMGVAVEMGYEEAFHALIVLRRIFLLLFGLVVAFFAVAFTTAFVSLRLRHRAREAEWEANNLGQYTLDEMIGEGGMGRVYRAHHAMLRRPTAVKLILPEKASDEAVKRFEREVQLTARLNHPNTIQIFDYGRTPEGVFYYAMEYLDGLTLKDLVIRHGPLPDGRVIRILQQAAESLQEAHEMGLVHRDIKPANIVLLNRIGWVDLIKVLDFGLIKDVRSEDKTPSEENMSQHLTGTPHYMSPESIETPDSVDARSDLYALGAVGYYLLTGVEVFLGKTVYEIFHGHTRVPPVAPSTRTKNPIDAKLESILLQCLEKRPEDRPQSAQELHDALWHCEPAMSWPESRAREWWDQSYGKEKPQPAPPSGLSSDDSIDVTLKVDFGNR